MTICYKFENLINVLKIVLILLTLSRLRISLGIKIDEKKVHPPWLLE
jgi:hypothetical protein